LVGGLRPHAHTFGHPCRIEEIVALCDDYGIPVVEDAAESLGSTVGTRHTGMTQPLWRLMHQLDMFQDCPHDKLENSLWLEERVVNIPSSVPDGALRSMTP